MDRLARNLEDLRSIVGQLNSRLVQVHFLQENLCFNGADAPLSTLLLSIMGAFAAFARALLRERQREGIALAKKRGAYQGRKRVLSDNRLLALEQRVAAGANKSQLAREMGISREALYQ